MANPTAQMVVELAGVVGEISMAYLYAVEATSDQARDHYKMNMETGLIDLGNLVSNLRSQLEKSPTGFLNPTPDEEDDNG